MSATRQGPGRWAGLGWKLFASYLAVLMVGVGMLVLTARLAAPSIFGTSMARMMSHTMGGMMGPVVSPTPQGGALDPTLTAAFRDSLSTALMLAAGVAIVAALGASLFFSRKILRPVQQLADASRRIAAGHYAERVPVDSKDELGHLAASFNEMADALEGTERRRLELIGDVAHELRTPVSTLEGYLEGLLDGVLEPSERTWAKLHDETGRVRRLIDDLQELSRAEAHQIPLHLESVDPAEIVRGASDRLAESFAEKGLEFIVDLPGFLPAVTADRERAVQVLTNLLMNALRYTPAPGAVRLIVRPRAGAVSFTVADSGLGIAAEHLPHVFERFYRVDKSRSRAVGGAGIGLTIARALVEAMNGRIWAESPGPGQGATFGFTLPVPG